MARKSKYANAAASLEARALKAFEGFRDGFKEEKEKDVDCAIDVILNNAYSKKPFVKESARKLASQYYERVGLKNFYRLSDLLLDMGIAPRINLEPVYDTMDISRNIKSYLTNNIPSSATVQVEFVDRPNGKPKSTGLISLTKDRKLPEQYIDKNYVQDKVELRIHIEQDGFKYSIAARVIPITEQGKQRHLEDRGGDIPPFELYLTPHKTLNNN